MVSADAPAEEQNATETAKTYKVNCDKRNTTGMENFTVQVLNASQVPFASSRSNFRVCASLGVKLCVNQTIDGMVLAKPQWKSNYT